ncbi:MAG: cytochrome c [Pseudomonadota bacterium]
MRRLLRLVGLTLVVVVTGLAAVIFVLAPAPRPPLAPAIDIDPIVADLDWQPNPASDDRVERGEVVFRASGCRACHTIDDGELLAGGRALETPFGTFYGPNITPDPENGIGSWTETEFDQAVRQGIAPDGSPYYPAFPYVSYAGMTDQDVSDLWAYLQTVPASDNPSLDHDLSLPYRWRLPLHVWRWLYFEPDGVEVSEGHPEAWQRGVYLVEVLGHCGECHTPRTFLGGLDQTVALGGASAGPDGGSVPDITPRALGDWSVSDMTFFFNIGMLPDGDFVGGDMGEVISHGTSQLSNGDRQAIAVYLLSLPIPED